MSDDNDESKRALEDALRDSEARQARYRDDPEIGVRNRAERRKNDVARIAGFRGEEKSDSPAAKDRRLDPTADIRPEPAGGDETEDDEVMMEAIQTEAQRKGQKRAAFGDVVSRPLPVRRLPVTASNQLAGLRAIDNNVVPAQPVVEMKPGRKKAAKKAAAKKAFAEHAAVSAAAAAVIKQEPLSDNSDDGRPSSGDNNNASPTSPWVKIEPPAEIEEKLRANEETVPHLDNPSLAVVHPAPDPGPPAGPSVKKEEDKSDSDDDGAVVVPMDAKEERPVLAIEAAPLQAQPLVDEPVVHYPVQQLRLSGQVLEEPMEIKAEEKKEEVRPVSATSPRRAILPAPVPVPAPAAPAPVPAPPGPPPPPGGGGDANLVADLGNMGNRLGAVLGSQFPLTRGDINSAQRMVLQAKAHIERLEEKLKRCHDERKHALDKLAEARDKIDAMQRELKDENVRVGLEGVIDNMDIALRQLGHAVPRVRRNRDTNADLRARVASAMLISDMWKLIRKLQPTAEESKEMHGRISNLLRLMERTGGDLAGVARALRKELRDGKEEDDCEEVRKERDKLKKENDAIHKAMDRLFLWCELVRGSLGRRMAGWRVAELPSGQSLVEIMAQAAQNPGRDSWLLKARGWIQNWYFSKVLSTDVDEVRDSLGKLPAESNEARSWLMNWLDTQMVDRETTNASEMYQAMHGLPSTHPAVLWTRDFFKDKISILPDDHPVFFLHAFADGRPNEPIGYHLQAEYDRVTSRLERDGNQTKEQLVTEIYMTHVEFTRYLFTLLYRGDDATRREATRTSYLAASISAREMDRHMQDTIVKQLTKADKEFDKFKSMMQKSSDAVFLTGWVSSGLAASKVLQYLPTPDQVRERMTLVALNAYPHDERLDMEDNSEYHADKRKIAQLQNQLYREYLYMAGVGDDNM